MTGTIAEELAGSLSPIVGRRSARKAPWGGVEAYDYGDSVNHPSNLSKVAGYFVGKALGHQDYDHAKIREMFWGHCPHYVKDGVVHTWDASTEHLRRVHLDHLHLALSH